MKYRFVVIVGFSLTALSGFCYANSEKEVDVFKKQTVKTVGELLKDKKTMTAWYEACMDDPGRLGQTPHCINAIAAEEKSSREHAFDRYRK